MVALLMIIHKRSSHKIIFNTDYAYFSWETFPKLEWDQLSILHLNYFNMICIFFIYILLHFSSVKMKENEILSRTCHTLHINTLGTCIPSEYCSMSFIVYVMKFIQSPPFFKINCDNDDASIPVWMQPLNRYGAEEPYGVVWHEEIRPPMLAVDCHQPGHLLCFCNS